MSQLYQCLNIAKNASQDEVRRAYHKLAMLYHPDRNRGDKVAEAKFKDLVSAFEILGDRKTRALYDQGRIDEQGRPRLRPASGPNPVWIWNEDANDVRKAFERRTSDIRAKHQSDKSATQTARMGDDEPADASAIFSTKELDEGGEKQYRLSIDFVEACLGAIKHVRLPNKAQFKINVPAGVETGQRLRVKSAGVNGKPFVVKITVEPHIAFVREGADIHLELPLTPYEAFFGIELDVPTVHGAAKVTIPAQVQDGDEIAMRHMGVRSKGAAFGDQIVSVKIVMPRSWSDEAAAAMEAWRQKSPFNPRGKILNLLSK